MGKEKRGACFSNCRNNFMELNSPSVDDLSHADAAGTVNNLAITKFPRQMKTAILSRV
jgi:hypothetical protein